MPRASIGRRLVRAWVPEKPEVVDQRLVDETPETGTIGEPYGTFGRIATVVRETNSCTPNHIERIGQKRDLKL
jgi:hypothetical protein